MPYRAPVRTSTRGPRAAVLAGSGGSGPAAAAHPVPIVAGRAPCPCGSGRRYKACHGRDEIAPDRVADSRRPFAGRADECDLVALREIVPSATAPLTLADGSGVEVLLGTVLPMAMPGMVRTDGRRMLGLQSPARSGDLDRDLGQALQALLAAEPGATFDGLPAPLPGPGFSALIGPAPLTITVQSGYDWWLEGIEDPGTEAAEAMETANAALVPTLRLETITAGYWCRIGTRTHLRWALPDDEEPLLDAFARLAHRQELTVGPDSRYVGAFRALGLVVPVWDLPEGTEAQAVEEPAVALRARLDEALADTTPLTSDERRTRAGVVSRQLTLR